MALCGQSETTTTPTKKNSITASTYLGSSSGLALDYRRDINKNREFIVGVQSAYNGVSGLNIGFRKYYYTENRLSVGFGFDAGLKQRNIIGNNFVSRTIESTIPKVDYAELRFVSGAYYKLNNKLDLMAEMQLKPSIFVRSALNNRRLKIGLKYNF